MKDALPLENDSMDLLLSFVVVVICQDKVCTNVFFLNLPLSSKGGSQVHNKKTVCITFCMRDYLVDAVYVLNGLKNS